MLASTEIRRTAPDSTAAPTPGAPATTKSFPLSVLREQSSTSRSAFATGHSWHRRVESLHHRQRLLRRHCHRRHHRVRRRAVVHKMSGYQLIIFMASLVSGSGDDIVVISPTFSFQCTAQGWRNARLHRFTLCESVVNTSFLRRNMSD